MKLITRKLNFLIPIKVSKLIRLGRNFDGGYLVCSKVLNKCNNLITLGVGDDTSFERDFIKRSFKNRIFLFDYSVNNFLFIKIIFKYVRRFLTFRSNIQKLIYSFKNFINFQKLLLNKNVRFFKKKVVLKPLNENEISLREIFSNSKSKDNLLKIDIEGYEYEIIEDVLKNSEKIQMLIIEFHSINNDLNKFIKKIKSLQKKFTIIHLHANNYKQSKKTDLFYDVVEITFINKFNLNIKNSNKIRYRYKFPLSNKDFECFKDRDPIKFQFKKN